MGTDEQKIIKELIRRIDKISSDTLTFEEWKKIFNSFKKKQIKIIAYNEMLKLANSFDNWYDLFFYSLDIYGSATTKNLVEHANSFIQWIIVYGLTIGEERKLALTKIQEFNPTFNHWLIVYRAYYNNNKRLVEIALIKLNEFNEPFYVWLDIYINCPYPDLKHLASKKIFEITLNN